MYQSRFKLAILTATLMREAVDFVYYNHEPGDRFFMRFRHDVPNVVRVSVMVDRVEVFEVADQLRALQGKDAVRVSVRRVRDKLLRKGSFTDVGEELRQWKIARNYQPVFELSELPGALQKRINDFGKALLDEVQASEKRIRDSELANFEIERAYYRETLDEAGMTVDVLEARVAALEAELSRMRASEATPMEPLETAVPDLVSILDKAPPPSVGDDIMKIIREILLDKGPMKPSAIRRELAPETVEAAKRYWHDGLDRLAKNMGERAGRGYYFVSVGGGRYAAKMFSDVSK